MVAEKKFETHSHTYKDDDGDEHETTVEVHEVTEQTRGDFVNRLGVVERSNVGDVLIRTNRPEVYDKLSKDEYSKLGYSKQGNSPSTSRSK